MLALVVLTALAASAAAKPATLLYSGLPLGYPAPLAYSYSAPYPYLAGPLSLAPGQPASILGSDGRPLDTLDVNLAKAQHFSAKALDGSGIHLLRKRSAALVAPVPLAHRYIAPAAALPVPYHAAPYAYTAPLAYSYAPTYVRTW